MKEEEIVACCAVCDEGYEGFDWEVYSSAINLVSIQ
jgi:hypothetical protein